MRLFRLVRRTFVSAVHITDWGIHMKQTFRCIFSILLVLVMTVCCLPVYSMAAGGAPESEGDSAADVGALQTPSEPDPMDIHYWDLLSAYEAAGYEDYTGAAVELPIQEAHSDGGAVSYADYDGVRAIQWDGEIAALEWRIDVPESALYCIETDYYAYNDKSADIQRELQVDGALLCVEQSNIHFMRRFVDDGEVRVDINGNESAPKMKQVYAWQTVRLADPNGYYAEPMKLYLSQGEHTITLKTKGNQPIAIGGIRLTAPKTLPDYAAAAAGYSAGAGEPILVEGEDSVYRSAASLRLDSSADLSCTPSDLRHDKINVAGGSAWKSSRQTICWEFEVPDDGLYTIGGNLYSYYNYGLPVYRTIRIDGKVPFAEMAAYRFQPDTKWRTEYLRDDAGEPYRFYFDRGKHTISMEVVAGDMTSVIRRLDADMDVLSELYLDITLITTSDPDVNYDYQLDVKLPHLMDTLQQLHENLQTSAQQIRSACRSDKALTYSEMQNTLDDYEILMRDAFEIPANLEQFNTMITQYGNWITQLPAGTLSIDKLVIVPAGVEYTAETVSAFQKVWAAMARFFTTFTNDYSSVIGSGVYSEEQKTIDVWYGGTQIWATEIQELIEADFAAKYNIQVRFRLTPSSQMSTGINAMLLAILSKTAPDAVLEAASIQDYMMRSQCYDLTQFEDFDPVAAQYPAVCFTPLTYRGGVYGLPLTLDIPMLFYRTDIFKKLQLSPPETWDEMIKTVIPRLAENSMTLSSSPGYEILLFQHGGELYNEDMTESQVASRLSWQAFKMHCDFYTMYGVPKTANFFNRFRSGETPIGFGSIANYIQFVYAAPELAGRWDIAVMPGLRREDGRVDHSIGGLTASSAMIMADAANPEEAWQFLKWYMSTGVQLEFSEIREAKLDMSARLLSANVEAFSALDWDSRHLRVFLQSMQQAKAYNPVLGDYYTSRYISYAFNNVVISRNMSEREALEYAQESINTELERRRKSRS